ncbi:MAG: RnfABCDGE type electron transport complex subunit D [Magnetococcales bacterium]|nr:RnfABCDGE type electron transport complex subunit D [Magnetococcales bacterium]
MNQEKWVVGTSPHVHSGDSVPQVMQTVIWALMPAAALSVLVFGWAALLVMIVTTLSAVLTEEVVTRMRGRSSAIGDRSAALTGLLLAMTLPPHTPWWVCVVGGAFAILIGKHLYGGLGHNPFNPALISRVFLLISFPVEMTYWPHPTPLFGDSGLSLSQAFGVVFGGHYPPGMIVDAITGATPLGQYRVEVGLGKSVQEALGGSYGFDYFKATGGMIGGSLGETSAVLLLLGGFYMMYRRLFTWHVPVSMLVGCLAPATIFYLVNPDRYPDPFFHLITGGLILGAFFMATDMVTSPVTARGQLIFGACCGLLTYIIRTWGGYPEGVSFAIVIMNSAVPLIDQFTRPTVYGKAKNSKK